MLTQSFFNKTIDMAYKSFNFTCSFFGWTSALHKAVEKNNIHEVRTLLNNCHYVDTQNLTTGETPLCIAAKNGFIDIASLLIENGANPKHFDFLNLSPLHHAVKNGQKEFVSFLVKKHQVPVNLARPGYPLLPSITLAAKNGDAAMFSLLKTLGATPSKKQSEKLAKKQQKNEAKTWHHNNTSSSFAHSPLSDALNKQVTTCNKDFVSKMLRFPYFKSKTNNPVTLHQSKQLKKTHPDIYENFQNKGYAFYANLGKVEIHNNTHKAPVLFQAILNVDTPRVNALLENGANSINAFNTFTPLALAKALDATEGSQALQRNEAQRERFSTAKP